MTTTIKLVKTQHYSISAILLNVLTYYLINNIFSVVSDIPDSVLHAANTGINNRSGPCPYSLVGLTDRNTMYLLANHPLIMLQHVLKDA